MRPSVDKHPGVHLTCSALRVSESVPGISLRSWGRAVGNPGIPQGAPWEFCQQRGRCGSRSLPTRADGLLSTPPVDWGHSPCHCLLLLLPGLWMKPAGVCTSPALVSRWGGCRQGAVLQLGCFFHECLCVHTHIIIYNLNTCKYIHI